MSDWLTSLAAGTTRTNPREDATIPDEELPFRLLEDPAFKHFGRGEEPKVGKYHQQAAELTSQIIKRYNSGDQDIRSFIADFEEKYYGVKGDLSKAAQDPRAMKRKRENLAEYGSKETISRDIVHSLLYDVRNHLMNFDKEAVRGTNIDGEDGADWLQTLINADNIGRPKSQLDELFRRGILKPGKSPLAGMVQE